jgi:hypothetical protein
MHRSGRSLLIIILLLAFIFSLSGSPLQTRSTAASDNIPYSVWVTGKETTGIPWTVYVDKPSLRADFRREFSITATPRQNTPGNLTFYARALDRQGRSITAVKAIARSEGSHFITLHVIARPGRYRLELALADGDTKRVSSKFEDVTVQGDPADPVERAFEREKPFEFVDPAPPPPVQERGPTGGELAGVMSEELRGALAGFTLRSPTILQGSLRGASPFSPVQFTVETSQPLHLSVVAVLTPPESHLSDAIRLRAFRRTMSNVLAMITRLRVSQGSVKFSGLDLVNRRYSIGPMEMNSVNVAQVNEILNADVHEVTLDALVGDRAKREFIKQALQTQLPAAGSDSPRRALLLVSARSDLDGPPETPLSVPADCGCRVFHLRFALLPNEADDVLPLLRNFGPRVFEPLSWTEFRDDFRKLLQDLSVFASSK